MNFKDKCKKELLSVLPENLCCIKAFLSAYTKCAGYIEGTGAKQRLVISFDTVEGANAACEYIKTLYRIEPELAKRVVDAPNCVRTAYQVVLPKGPAFQALEEFELLRKNEEGLLYFTHSLPQELLKKECCMTAYFKGLFLACGSVYVPEQSDDESKKKHSYHFELDFDDEEFANCVMEFMSDLRINTKMSDRSGHKLLYVKACDEILDVICKLELVNCAGSLKKLIEDRETSNALNRSAICETANMDKVFALSSRHLIAIAKLKSGGVFEGLPISLKEAAEARSEFPEASLQELADKLGVSKSCLRHRFEKIESLADGLTN